MHAHNPRTQKLRQENCVLNYKLDYIVSWKEARENGGQRGEGGGGKGRKRMREGEEKPGEH